MNKDGITFCIALINNQKFIVNICRGFIITYVIKKMPSDVLIKDVGIEIKIYSKQ